MRTVLLGLTFAAWFVGGGHQLSNPAPPESRDVQASLSVPQETHPNSRSKFIVFRLTNSETAVECHPETWALLIDGKPITYAGRMIFGNGPAPVEGFNTLQPGASFVFSKNLDLAEFFPQDRYYRLTWRASGFESNTVLIHGPTQ